MSNEFNLAIGEYAVSSGKNLISCNGLGSCIAIFLHHKASQTGGGIHVMFPEKYKKNSSLPPSYYTSTGITYLIRAFEAKGIKTNELTAQVTGGASLFSNLSTCIGSLNAQEVCRTLTKRGIFIKTIDIGGNFGRSAKFDTQTGEITIKTNYNNYNTQQRSKYV